MARWGMENATIHRSVAEIARLPLAGFFQGWPNPPDEAMHRRILRDSYAVSLALSEGRVVGFANALSDGYLSAYIPLLEVLPEYRGRGLGSTLITDLVEQLDGLYTIDLCCDENLEPFYRRLGFSAGNPGARILGMVRRKQARRPSTPPGSN